jgi:hypothetical protein
LRTPFAMARSITPRFTGSRMMMLSSSMRLAEAASIQ